MLPLETKMPSFSLINTIDNNLFDSQLLPQDKGTLIMFICNHCPYVIHYHDEIKKIYQKYKLDLNFIAISSNDAINYPDDSPDKMKKLFNDKGLDFPYLFDETQEIAKKFQAECTPEFYLFDNFQKLIYRGRLDGSSPGNNIKITGEDLRNAIEALLKGDNISLDQKPSIGCSIKWK